MYAPITPATNQLRKTVTTMYLYTRYYLVQK